MIDNRKFIKVGSAAWAENNAFTEKGFTYDYNGNIKTLNRNLLSTQTNNNYTYNYNGDKLSSISIASNGNAGVSNSYLYDENGNMIKDYRKIWT